MNWCAPASGSGFPDNWRPRHWADNRGARCCEAPLYRFMREHFCVIRFRQQICLHNLRTEMFAENIRSRCVDGSSLMGLYGADTNNLPIMKQSSRLFIRLPCCVLYRITSLDTVEWILSLINSYSNCSVTYEFEQQPRD